MLYFSAQHFPKIENLTHFKKNLGSDPFPPRILKKGKIEVISFLSLNRDIPVNLIIPFYMIKVKKNIVILFFPDNPSFFFFSFYTCLFLLDFSPVSVETNSKSFLLLTYVLVHLFFFFFFSLFLNHNYLLQFILIFLSLGPMSLYHLYSLLIFPYHKQYLTLAKTTRTSVLLLC